MTKKEKLLERKKCNVSLMHFRKVEPFEIFDTLKRLLDEGVSEAIALAHGYRISMVLIEQMFDRV